MIRTSGTNYLRSLPNDELVEQHAVHYGTQFDGEGTRITVSAWQEDGRPPVTLIALANSGEAFLAAPLDVCVFTRGDRHVTLSKRFRVMAANQCRTAQYSTDYGVGFAQYCINVGRNA